MQTLQHIAISDAHCDVLNFQKVFFFVILKSPQLGNNAVKDCSYVKTRKLCYSKDDHAMRAI